MIIFITVEIKSFHGTLYKIERWDYHYISSD